MPTNKRGYYHFYFFFFFYSTLTPSSFIPRSLDLHIRQVDDCVADNKEVMLEGGQVDMQAEEVEEHVGVDLSVGVVGKNIMRNRSA